MDAAVTRLFLETAVWRLQDDYLPKLRRCFDELSDEQLWWRPNPACNSVGNLFLHLAGNVRQWLLNGVGGQELPRDRGAEFAEEGPLPRDVVWQHLESTVAAGCEVIQVQSQRELLRPRTIQVYDHQTAVEAIFHVVEHFSGHTGQVIYITKMLTAHDLGFYSYLNGDATPQSTTAAD